MQIQIGSPASVHPQRSLLSLAFIVLLMTLAAVMLHLLDFATGVQNGKSLVLDFVGQSQHRAFTLDLSAELTTGKSASLARILLLDLLLFVLQMTGLVVSYVTSHGSNIPSNPSLPFDDLLLPPHRSTPSDRLHRQVSGDIEEGRSLRRRKSGPGAAYSPVEGEDGEDEDAVWLDEAEDVALQSLDRSRKGRPHGSPLIFSLSLPHMIALVTSLPAPRAPPGSLLGTTPLASPRTGSTDLPTGTTDLPTSSTLPTSTSASTGTGLDSHTEAENEEEDDADEDEEQAAGRRRLRGAAGLMPGSYWTARRGQG